MTSGGSAVLGLSTRLLPGTLASKFQQAGEVGFDALCLDQTELEGAQPEDLATLIERFGVPVQALEAGFSLEDLGAGDDGAGLNTEPLRAAFATCAVLDIPVLVLPTGRAGAEPDWAALAALADRYRTKLAILPTPGSAVLADETAMAAMLAAVPEPRLGLALNAAHVLHDGAQPARLRGLPGERIHHVQLVDAAGDSAQRPEDLLPGQGDLNLAALVRLLARSGYSGPWCLTRNTGPDAVSSAPTSRPQPQSAARDGYRALVALLDDVARTAPDFARPQPMLPDRVYPKGLEFIEFATDEAGREPLVQQLEALCFRLERRHVSKAVELWRQGGVNIVINTEPAQRPPSDAHKSRPRVSEIGLRVSDSRQTVKRAAMLGAPVHESIVAEGELELPAVKGVGGSIVHFIDEQSDLHRVWDIEFNPVTKTRATQPCGLRRIDHVSQTMPLDEMQSWLTYYTSTFEMEKTALTGVADPSGPILSQALSSPAGEVRLNLNGAAAQRTFADSFLEQGMTAGVQHIAFATDDIFETAERLQQTGLERLRIDGGYYTALQQHFGLDSAALARLQHHSILYDRDGEGEYFQLYCRPIFNGFFFEIVERRGGYPGYGARNASVRLAAQVEQQSQTTGQRGQATP